MKQCIWCKKTESETPFDTKAHTVPKSLGGKRICENVCDECNQIFGRHYFQLPPVENAIKEAFHVTRARFLEQMGEVGRNKIMTKADSSTYFKIDLAKKSIKPKASYRLQKGFLRNFGRQLKKGLYKIYLEETERINKNGHDERFDFIRHFARYNIGDFPVFYFKRSFAAVFMHKDFLDDPHLEFDPEHRNKMLYHGNGFYEFELIGHVIGVAERRFWELELNEYLRETIKIKTGFFHPPKPIDLFTDFDILLESFEDRR